MRGGYIGAAALVSGSIPSRAYNFVSSPLSVKGEPPNRQEVETLHTYIIRASVPPVRPETTIFDTASTWVLQLTHYPIHITKLRRGHPWFIGQRPIQFVILDRASPVYPATLHILGSVLEPPTLLQANGHGQLAETDLLALL